MKLKTATLLALIGSCISAFNAFMYLLLRADIIGYDVYDSMIGFLQILAFLAPISFINFFYVLYKNQK